MESNTGAGGRGWLAAGTRVDHFQVVRPLGRGGAGEVYLARDLELGRQVALKLVLPESLGEADVVARFIQEARLTARFSHPHIVTIHAVGDFDGRPYVALEYLKGQTLRERLAAGRPGAQEAVRIGLAVAQALAVAHENQVLHRDLKPENVLVPDDGRLRVVDFGLARAVEAEGPDGSADPGSGDAGLVTEGLVGTPAYMAPERWRRQAVGPAVDVWAFGIIMHELLSGRRPFLEPDPAGLRRAICSAAPVPGLPGDDLPAGLVDLVAACLAKDPDDRPSAALLVATLRRLLPGGGQQDELERGGPFPGLLPYAEQDAGWFFGREAEVAAALERLRIEPVLPVVGPSGAGKSSFVQAGLIPRLREQGHWIVLALRPGGDPLGALAHRLARGQTPATIVAPDGATSASDERMAREQDLRQRLARAPGRLVLELNQLAEQERARVLLFVDQLEEVFQAESEDERRAFLQAVFTAADDPEGPVRVVVTARDDFLGRLAESRAARDALGQVLVLRSPSEETLQAILHESIERTGLAFDDELLPAEMAAAVGAGAAGLPLLQFAGQLLWERRDREHGLLTRAAYEQMGGVEGALANHADGVLQGMTGEQVGLARQLCLRLVGEDGTRRLIAQAELLDGLPAAAEVILARLVDARLLSVRRGSSEGGDQAELELAHESLAITWERLRRWRDESREELRISAELEQAARLWEQRGRRPDEAWTGSALAEAERKVARLPAVTERVGRFLAQGRERERRRVRRKRWFIGLAMAGLAALAAAATVVALVVADQRSVAEHERTRAEQGQAEALRSAALAAYDRGDFLEARARVRMALERDDSLAGRALWARLERQPLLWERKLVGVLGADWSPTGGRIAIGPGAPLELLDGRTGDSAGSLKAAGAYLATSFSADGRTLAAGGTLLSILDTDTLAFKASLPVRGMVMDLCLADGGRVLATTVGPRLQLHPLPLTNQHVSPAGLGGAIACAWERPWILTVNRAGVGKLVRADSGEPILDLPGHTAKVSAVDLTDDGRQAASGDEDGTVRLWRFAPPDAGQPPVLIPGPVIEAHDGALQRLRFAADGARLATGGEDGLVKVFDVATGQLLRELPAHGSPVTGLAFSPSGDRLLVTNRGGWARAWSLEPAGIPREPTGHESIFLSAAVSADAGLVASGELQGRPEIWLWDGPTGRPVGTLKGHTQGITDLAFHPRAPLLASASTDGSVRLWNLTDLSLIGELRGWTGGARSVAFSPSGDRLAAADQSGTVRVWKLDAGRVAGAELVRFDSGGGSVARMAFHPSGSLLAVTFRSGGLALWDLPANGGPARRRALSIEGPAPYSQSAAFHPGGDLLAVGGEQQKLLLVDLRTGRARPFKSFASPMGTLHRAMDFHPAGRLLGAAPGDGLPKAIWDLSSGRQLSSFDNVVGPGMVFAFSRDGRVVLTDESASAVLWDAATGAPRWRGDLMLTDPPRLHTHLGWIDPGDGRPVPPPEGDRWLAALQAGPLSASMSNDGDVLCLLTAGHAVELWDLGADRRRLVSSDHDYVEIVAIPGGCLASYKIDWQPGGGSLLRPDAPAQELPGKILEVVRGPGEYYLIAEKQVRAFAFDGTPRGTWPLAAVATRAVRVPGGLAVGHFNGVVEILDDTGGPPRQLLEPPGVPIVELLRGPADTLVVAACNGLIGVWSLQSGERLDSVKLNGRPTQVAMDGDRLLAATLVGDHALLDLSALRQPHCDLLSDVWSQVPVVWRAGQAVVEAPRADHPCRKNPR